MPVCTSSSCWQALLKAEALTFQFLFLVSAASSFITFFLSSSSSCNVCVFFVRVSTFDCACIIYIYFCCLTESTRKICKTMQNFQANNFPTLRSASQLKKERAKKINQKYMRTRKDTHTHRANMCTRMCVCGKLYSQIYSCWYISHCAFFSFILTLLHAHKCRALVGLPRSACLFACWVKLPYSCSCSCQCPVMQQETAPTVAAAATMPQNMCCRFAFLLFVFAACCCETLTHILIFFFFDLLPLQSSRNFSKISVKRNVTILFVLRRLCCNLNAHTAVAHSSMISC